MDTRKTVATTSTVNSKVTVMPLHSVSMVIFHLLTLLYILCHAVSGEVYYIKPSANSPCISEHCLTLSHFADNSSRFINADTTVILLSGSHNLESELLISNVSKIRMYSLSSNMTIINCDKHARVSFVAVDHVYISGLKYNKCRGHYVRSVHIFSLKKLYLS